MPYILYYTPNCHVRGANALVFHCCIHVCLSLKDVQSLLSPSRTVSSTFHKQSQAIRCVSSVRDRPHRPNMCEILENTGYNVSRDSPTASGTMAIIVRFAHGSQLLAHGTTAGSVSPAGGR